MTDPDSPQPMRRLRINLDDLEEAFENTHPGGEYFLDLHTGAVVLVTEDLKYEYRQVNADLGEAAGETWEAAFEAAMDEADTPEWQREILLDIGRVERFFGELPSGARRRSR
jgi:hypothetical protein